MESKESDIPVSSLARTLAGLISTRAKYNAIEVEKTKVLVSPFQVVPYTCIRDVSIGGEGVDAIERTLESIGLFHDMAPYTIELSTKRSEECEEIIKNLPQRHREKIEQLRSLQPLETPLIIYGLVDGAHRTAVAQRFCFEERILPYKDPNYKMPIKVPVEDLGWTKTELVSAAQHLNIVTEAVVGTCFFDKMKQIIRTKQTVRFFISFLSMRLC